jgi:exonuclease SbcD
VKILHTADWHIGQLFYEYDRTWEHQQFLGWLVNTLKTEAIDVLLVSGDVFDLSNPSAASIRLFYSFLNRATTINPGLQIVVTAGNHDSAARLESPKPLLESTNIHIVGVVEWKEDGTINYDKLCVPLKGSTGQVEVWCLAIPFLRMGDYPVIPDSEHPYGDGVARVYGEAYRFVLQNKRPGQAVIALGHLHTQLAEVSDLDRAERAIMGGVEFVGASAFHEEIRYVALGHIHKAQRIGGREHVRYSGSPLPMSFSEINYRHQVVIFDLAEDRIADLRILEVPVAVELFRIPAAHRRIPGVLTALAQLPEVGVGDEPAPYLEVRVLADGPEPGLRHRVEQALVGKAVRLAKIDVRYANAANLTEEPVDPSSDELNELSALEVFSRAYQARYEAPAPENLIRLFNEIVAEADQTE